MFRRLLRIGLAVAIALLVGVPGCVVWHSRDLPEVSDGDLAIPPLMIEDPEANAFTHLERAAAALVWPENPHESLLWPHLGDGWDPEEAEQLLAGNEAALAHLLRALEAPSFQMPRRDFFEDSSLEHVSFFTLRHLLPLRAALHADRGETRAALEDGLAAVRLGHCLQNAHQITLFEMMVGVGFEKHGLRAVREAAVHSPVDAALAREFGDRLDRYRTEPEAWKRMWAWEYQSHKVLWDKLRASPLVEEGEAGVIANLAEGDFVDAIRSLIPKAYVFHYRRSLSLEAEFARSMQRNSFKTCAELEPPMEFVPEDQDERLRMVFSPNSVGKILLAIYTPDFRRFQLRRCETDTVLAATRAVLALEAYRRERGALPQSLEELVPTYLSEVPQDGFDGNPLRYLPERALVYSVGADLLDEGGLAEEPDEGNLDEPVFHLGDPPNAVGESAAG
jgi:hypothetical protein